MGSHDFTWLTKLIQHIHVAEVIKEVVLKEREGAEWEGVKEVHSKPRLHVSLSTCYLEYGRHAARIMGFFSFPIYGMLMGLR